MRSNTLSQVSVARAFAVRLLFASHGIVSIWRLAAVTGNNSFWYLASTLGLLVVESLVTIVKRDGKEWKWVCPSVMIYLMTSVPAIWFLELYEFDRRRLLVTRIVRSAFNQTTMMTAEALLGNQEEDLSAPVGSLLGVKFEVRIPLKLTSDQWIRMLEQMLLLVLIIGRWLLPKGKLSHDQLSQLLLVYIGTAADIVEFFEAFKEKEVQHHKVLCIIILGIWSMSLMQFTLVLTATRGRRDKSRLYVVYKENGGKSGFCHEDVFGILISMLLQDLPFLVLRLILIFHFHVLSYTNTFFTFKNSLVIALLVYRLVVLFLNRKGKQSKRRESIDSVQENLVPNSGIFRRTSEARKSLIQFHEIRNFHFLADKSILDNLPAVYRD